jgi:hypothetical protein
LPAPKKKSKRVKGKKVPDPIDKGKKVPKDEGKKDEVKKVL